MLPCTCKLYSIYCSWNGFLNWQCRKIRTVVIPSMGAISVLISISSITEYVSPLSICIAFPRIDGMHQILFRGHFHKQPLIPDGHMVSGVRTHPPILGRD